MRTFYALSLLALVLMFASIQSCKHHPESILPINNGGGGSNPGDTVIINPNPCNPGTVYFTNTILPLLNSKCALPDCHDQVSHQDGVGMYSYNTIMQQVTPGNLNNSDLYEVITEDNPNDIMPPSPYNALSNAEIQLIATWILQGAQNNSCTPDCDPTASSFSQNIWPTVQLACNGCHSGGNPSANLSLTTYEQVKAIALDGRLMNVLNGTNGYSIMPDNTAGLPSCNKNQFQNWVNAGAPNN